jgi:tRNA U34 5-carboxymethylaminomethyl modifying GTPase MnmE/TrmE
VANKSDLVPPGSPQDGRSLAVSALTGEGICALSAVLQSWMESTLPLELDQINSERQAEAVGQALAGCHEALRVLECGGSEDLATPGLIRVQEALDALLGGGAPEDLYDRVFARFCIGK